MGKIVRGLSARVLPVAVAGLLLPAVVAVAAPAQGAAAPVTAKTAVQAAAPQAAPQAAAPQAAAAAVAAPTPAACGFTAATTDPARVDPDRFTVCLWKSVTATEKNAAGTTLGTQAIKAYEWFVLSGTGLTLTHGVAFQSLSGKGSMATGGLKLSAPQPCPKTAPTGTGCSTSATGAAVATGPLSLTGTYSNSWSETMVLGAATSATRSTFRDPVVVTPTGPTPGSTVTSFTLGTADAFRCDRVLPGTGCVNPAFVPTVALDATANPSVEPVARHVRAAQESLAGHPGRPGSGQPLTRVTDSASVAAHASAACASFVADPPTDTACDAYPFAETSQGGTGASVAPVPAAALSSRAGLLTAGVNAFRVAAGDGYYVQVTAPEAHPGSASLNAEQNSLFGSYGDAATCDRWSGADATNSVVLPDGQRAWFFSDSYLGSPAKRKELFTTSTVHNSVVVQNGTSLRTMTGGNTCQEGNSALPFADRYAKSTATAPDAATGGFYWTGDQLLVGSNVVKFYYHGVPNGDVWTNDYAAVATIPAASLQSGTVLTVNPTRLTCAAGGPPALWGTMSLNRVAKDGYVYVYGTSSTVPQQLYLARTTTANLTNFAAWQFFTAANSNGTATWGTCAAAAPLPIGNAMGGGVTEINGTVWLIQHELTSSDPTTGQIVAHPSATPWGFGARRVPLYTPPEADYEFPYYHLVYEPRVQPGLTDAANSTPHVVLSYNVNTTAVDTGCVGANAYDGSVYRPRFVDIPTSWFNTYDASTDALAAPAVQANALRAQAKSAQAKPAPTIYQGRRPLTNPKAPAPGHAVRSSAASGLARAAAATGIGGVTDWYPHWGVPCPQVPTPANLTAAVTGDGTANLAWTTPGTDIWSYVYQCDSSATTCSTTSSCAADTGGWSRQLFGFWVTSPQASLRPVGTSAANGHTFGWYACSSGAQNPNPIGVNGNGGPSNRASAKVTVPVPSAPTGLKGTRSGTKVTLTWTAVTYPTSDNIYTPYYWDITNGQTSAQAVAAPVTSGTTTTVTLPSSTHRYGVYLKAKNLAGSSAASASVTV